MDGRALRSGILQFLATTQGSPWAVSNLAVVLQEDERLVAAVLDLLEEEGLVQYPTGMGAGRGEVRITSRGYVEAMDDAATPGAAATEEPVRLALDPGEARRKLQEELEQLNKLGKRRTLTLGDIEAWRGWTETVIRRAYGDTSRQLKDFEAIMEGYWRGPVPNLWGYRQRLPRWRALLTTWVREFDEFGAPGQPAEQYIAPKSQFDAYGALKDKVKGAVGSVTLVDPYTDDATLQPLLCVDVRVNVRVLTVKPSADFGHALELFRQQWGGNVEARRGPKELHDRFLLVDDRVFFSGASFKDLGRKGSVIAEIRTDAIKKAVKKDIEAWWKAAQPIV